MNTGEGDRRPRSEIWNSIPSFGKNTSQALFLPVILHTMVWGGKKCESS